MQDRRAAGNGQGAVDCVIRLGLLDDESVDARRTAARTLVDRGESKHAARLPPPAPDRAPALAEEVDLPVESGADLPLESFFEELRGKVARDQEVRAREQLERGLRQVAENRQEKP